MKIIKILLVIIALLVAGFFIYASMSPKVMGVHQSAVIDSPISSVMEEISDFNKWEAWSPWKQIDSTMVNEIEGIGLNSKNSWTSDHPDVGNGSQKIIELKEDYLRTEMYFGEYGPFYANFDLESVEEGTKVTWNYEDQEMGLMERGIMGIMGQQEKVDNQFKNGLSRLKNVVEAKPKAPIRPEFVISERQMEEKHYISLRKKVSMAELSDGQAHGQAYGEIMAYLGQNGIQPAGMPICIVYEYSEDGDSDLGFSMPVAELPNGIPENLEGVTIPAGRVAAGIHYGNYDDVAPAWYAMEEYQKDKGLNLRAPYYESYLNDPTTVKSEMEIMTEIVYPVD